MMKNEKFKLNYFPWEKNEKPLFVNDGFEWFIYKKATRQAEELQNIVVYYVKKNKNVDIVIIDIYNQKIIFSSKDSMRIWDMIEKLKISAKHKL